jgi:glucosylceramidase
LASNIKLARLPNINLTVSHSSPHALTISIDSDKKYQVMDGFGASLTEASSWLLAYRLDDTTRAQIMSDLFSANGIHLSLLRQPIGATDFSLDAWSLNDSPNDEDDFDLSHFSLKKDQTFILPMLKQALSQSHGNIKLIGSPWSPPAWMKTKRHLFGNGGSLRKECYDAYANYFVKYLQGYAERGFRLDAITPQNEPQYGPEHYPGLLMTPEEQAAFIGGHLGPKIRQAGFQTKIYAFDHNFDDNRINYPEKVLSDPKSRLYVNGSAWHPYCANCGHHRMSEITARFPEYSVHMTEAGSGTWIGDENAQFEDQMRHLIRTPRNFGKSVIFWNVALDQNSGPKLARVDPPGTNRGLLTIRSDVRNNITKNSGFYSMAHSAKFVLPRSVRIQSNQFDDVLENVAYSTPDGYVVLILINKQSKDESVAIQWNGKGFTFTASAKSGYTLRWKK